MTTLAQKLNGYSYGIETYHPDEGEGGLLNSISRYLGEHIDKLSKEEQRKLAEADAIVPSAVEKSIGTWEEDIMRDMLDTIRQGQVQRATDSPSTSNHAAMSL